MLAGRGTREKYHDLIPWWQTRGGQASSRPAYSPCNALNLKDLNADNRRDAPFGPTCGFGGLFALAHWVEARFGKAPALSSFLASTWMVSGQAGQIVWG